VETITRADSPSDLAERIGRAQVILHFAGVNRPTNPREFESGNVEFTRSVCELALAALRPPILFASSVQAGDATPYGRSKLAAEGELAQYAMAGGSGAVYRLANVFGPGARPNYNSAVATFAHNAANGLPLSIHDASSEIPLVYVHAVVRAFCNIAVKPPEPGVLNFQEAGPVTKVSVGTLAETMESFAQIRSTLRLPDLSSLLQRQLYATFLSYIPKTNLAYELPLHTDLRGSLAEFLKTPFGGQIFVSRTSPGITRGNHFHHTKVEKFLVLSGDAVVRFRPVGGESEKCFEYRISGEEFRVIDIPPDHSHSIENVGTDDMVVLFWASEIFDPAEPDTYPLNVQ